MLRSPPSRATAFHTRVETSALCTAPAPDEPRSGRPRRIGDDAVAEAVRKTLEDKTRDIVGL